MRLVQRYEGGFFCPQTSFFVGEAVGLYGVMYVLVRDDRSSALGGWC